MGSIPATLDITFLKRRVVSSQFQKPNQRNRLLIKPKKTLIRASVVTLQPSFTPANASPAYLKSDIRLTRIRTGQRLYQKPHKTIRRAKLSFFFTFKSSTSPYLHSTEPFTLENSTYFWQIYSSHTQFSWLNPTPMEPQFFKSGELRTTSLGYIDWKPEVPLSQTFFKPIPRLESKTYPQPPLNRLFNAPFLPLQLLSNLSSYEMKTSASTQRTLTLRLNAFQKVLYSQTKYYKMLKGSVARFNITSRYIKKRFLVLFPHQLSPQTISGSATREQVPDFRDISRTRSYFTPSFTKISSLQGSILSKKKKPLTRIYTHFTPLINISQHMRLFTQGSITQAALSRSKLTRLTARVFRQFMIKRLFRPTPVKTYLRSIRRIRRCWTQTHLSSLLPQVKKFRKLASDRAYEEALFKEMLSTLPGVEGPLLKTFLYTGFEAMPSMNQKLGNTLFKKNRRLRSSVLANRVPNRGKRRHFVRTQLRLTTPWAQRADLLRPTIKNFRDDNAALASLYRTNAAEKRRYRHTLRYWRKRTAYFSRHSLAFTLFKRKYPRFKRKLRLRKKKLSRNFTIRKELRLLGHLKPKSSIKKQTRFQYRSRTRKRKKKKKLKGFKLHSRRQFLLNFRFRFLTRKLQSSFQPLQKSFWRRRRSLRKRSRLFKRLRLRAKLGTENVPTAFFELSRHFNDFLPITHPMGKGAAPLSTHPTPLVPLLPVLQFWASQSVRKYSFFYQILQCDVYATSQKFHPTPTHALNFSLILQNQLNAFCFGPQLGKLQYSNLWTYPSSQFSLRKKILRSFSQSSFTSDTGSWAHKCLIQFAERISGRRVAIYIGPFVDQALTLEDHARCILWNTRSSGFKKMLGHRIFTSEALMVLTSSIRLKDPTLLSNWIRGMLKRMSFWKYRVIFRYLKFLLQHLFRFSFPEFHFKGFKLRLKGKISVGGNSRSRVLFYRVGDTSHSKMSNRVAYDLSYINTFTGVLGFKLWFFY